MANRFFNQFHYTFENGPVILNAKLFFQEEPTTELVLLQPQSKGFWKFEHPDVGIYQFFTGLSAERPDKYVETINVITTIKARPLFISNAAYVQFKTDLVTGVIPYIEINVLDITGNFIDIEPGESLLLTTILRNSNQ